MLVDCLGTWLTAVIDEGQAREAPEPTTACWPRSRVGGRTRWSDEVAGSCRRSSDRVGQARTVRAVRSDEVGGVVASRVRSVERALPTECSRTFHGAHGSARAGRHYACAEAHLVGRPGPGTCGLGRLQEEAPEVFYALTPWGRGRGAATWAVLALVGWAVDHGRPRVRLRIIDGNVASEKVAARAGFSPGAGRGGIVAAPSR